MVDSVSHGDDRINDLDDDREKCYIMDMMEHVRGLFSRMIGGTGFGTGGDVSTFEKIKQAKYGAVFGFVFG